ncbi:rhomboid family intramembrane serine protease [Sporichthya sp.]|uniref:rhomboid family intramembrane serine protease n=1 Tax=Sporichthya sp. TaxID=65475 RepID=UPI0017CC715B|nr:rhomboid family intramembrane serine protease [Sporichthya sp.]MBA3744806.1 rhomboid family intramembrane serine protease [Sporichthya sp.]
MADDAGSGETPVCYRHPGRETYVRCGRCDRYICPDDMISASVGFQCPECVHEGNKGVREPRTVAGAAVRQDTGVVTISIIVVNVLIFFAVQGSDKLLLQLSLNPFGEDGDGVAQGGWHRLITAAFTHEESLHIAMNMIALWLFGRPLEAMLGRSRFMATYLLCALGGSALSYLFMGLGDPGSIGASGAVFGLVGTLVIVDRQLWTNPTSVAIFLTIMLLPGFIVANIDWRGHVGGLITGGLLGALFIYAPTAHRIVWQVGGMVAITAVSLLGVQLHTDHLEDELRERGFTLSAPPAPVVPSGDNGCGELQPCDSSVLG